MDNKKLAEDLHKRYRRENNCSVSLVIDDRFEMNKFFRK